MAKKLITLLLAMLALTACNSDEDEVVETSVTSGDLMAPYFLNDMDNAGYFWTFSGSEAAYGVDESTMVSNMTVRCIAFYTSWRLEDGQLSLDGTETHKIKRLEPRGGYIIKIDDSRYLPSTNAKHGNVIDKYLIQSGFTKQLLMDALRESSETGNSVVMDW